MYLLHRRNSRAHLESDYPTDSSLYRRMALVMFAGDEIYSLYAVMVPVMNIFQR